MIENQALRPLVDAFEKKYPFVDVEYWRGDSRAMVQKLLSEQRARRIVGDIFEFDRRRRGGDPRGRVPADLVAVGGELSARP